MKKAFPWIVLLVLVSLSVPPSAEAQGGLPVVTLVCDHTLRDQPNENAAVVATLGPGEPMMLVTGRDVTGDWLVTLRQNGQTGWLRDNQCVRVQGSRANAPLTVPAGFNGPPFATVGCTQYIRSAPGEDSARLAILYPGESILRVVGRDEQVVGHNTVVGWLLVESTDGLMGWVYDMVVRYPDGTLDQRFGSPCIRVSGNVFDVPVMDDIEMPVPNPDGSLPPTLETDLPTATVGCTQYIRSAPRNDSPRLAILYPRDGILEILGRDRSGEWLLILSQSGLMGWVVDTQCIVVRDNVFDAPITTDVVMPVPGVDDVVFDIAAVAAGEGAAAGQAVTPIAPIPLPNARVGCTQYIRSAPNNDSARLAILYPSDGILEILARDRIAEWLLVRSQSGLMGWVVNTRCIHVIRTEERRGGKAREDRTVPGTSQEVLPFPGATPPPDWPPQ